MDETSQPGHLYIQFVNTDPGRTNISEPNMLRVVVGGTSIDSHYLLDAYYDYETYYGYGMVYEMTQHDGVQYQPNLDIGVSVASNASHTEIGIPFLHRFGPWGSMIQAPTPSPNVSSLENSRMNLQRYHDRSRRSHRFAHQHYHHHGQPVQVQEIRGHSNSHARRGNSHARRGNSHARRGNMHNLLEVASFRDHHNDMQLDIDDMSYEELLVLGERIGNVERGLSEEIIARQMQTKTYLLPNNLEGSTSEEQDIDLCIICQEEYKNKEEIGILQCRHEYHADCIRRWLHEKNVCPMCKSKALAIG